ncbi:cyclic AMP-dependent transcription factor ATF-6 beta isoform X1 [Antechinus flavipes]|uniref:cyclic AMP-dependent transcription factor ATF-6 beta isoform X1 n=1 Tax=Antechinus flavipes TaxID=38775 RepID=UPI002236166F|nr:cyclic AMP-dependent transcription factor ATF-6 beta isoform X1 [Antechinus flavipes]
MAAELLLLSEIADPTRFFADNLLSAEDWDRTLYNCLDEVTEDQVQLFRCLEQDVPFDSGSMDMNMNITSPEPPWDPLPIFPDLQVKSEPSSPSLSFESSLLFTEPLGQVSVGEEVLGVKIESPSSPHCLLGKVLKPSFGAVQISVGFTPDDPSDIQTKTESISSSSSLSSETSLLSEEFPSKPFVEEESLGLKKESPAPQLCLLGDVLTSPFGSAQINVGPNPEGPSGKALPHHKPPLPPKPVMVTNVPLCLRNSPPSTTVVLQPLGQPPPVSSGSSVVLFQGPVQVQPPIGEGSAPSTPRLERKSIVPAPMLGTPCLPEVDAKVLKRQQRMIKNRESACQSRRKKKEYLQGLEARLQVVLSDNQQLRRENAALRRRLEGLLAENSELKFGSGNRKVICVMVFLLFIAFNFGPVSINEVPPAPASPQMGREESWPQRHLLEFSEQGVVTGQDTQGIPLGHKESQPRSAAGQPYFKNLTTFSKGAKELFLRDLDQFFLSSDCRHFNRTESLRLADELSGWVQRHQSGRKRSSQLRKIREKQKFHQWKKPPPAWSVPPRPSGPPERDSVGQLQLYHHPRHPQPEFLDAIDRREDTFYVVSFRRDHLLLPAISHNKTSRPKMSLVMPAMTPNETLSGRGNTGDYEVMMQIECEVMDTRVIHIKSSTVPPSLRKQPPPPSGNASGNPLPSTPSSSRQTPHQPFYLSHP